jgi:hypothetical protein
MIYSNKRIVLFALTMCVIALSSVKAQETRGSIGRNRKTAKESGGKDSSKSKGKGNVKDKGYCEAGHKEMTLSIRFTGAKNPAKNPANEWKMPSAAAAVLATKAEEDEDEDPDLPAIEDQTIIDSLEAAFMSVDPQSQNPNRHLQGRTNGLLGGLVQQIKMGMGKFPPIQILCGGKSVLGKYCQISIVLPICLDAEYAKHVKAYVNSQRFRINFATALATILAVTTPYIVVPIPVGTSIMLESSHY